MTINLKILFLLGLLTISIASCSDQGDPSNPVSPDGNNGIPTWSGNIQPLLTQRCIACHGGSGGLILDSYESALRGGNSGAVIIPDNSAESIIIKKLSGITYSERMPLGCPYLSEDQIEMVRNWIDDGAQDN